MESNMRGRHLVLDPHFEQPARQLAQRIQDAEHLYLATHFEPDGDAIGSLLGLAWVLRRVNKKVTAACADPVPDVVEFLPGIDTITDAPPSDEDLIISLDAGGLDRLGDLYVADRFAGRPVVNIDHHVTNTEFGDIVLVDPQAAATAEILYLLYRMLDMPLTLQSAVCLLTGIVTDTRSFRTSNTTPRVLQVAAKLMQFGATLPEIAQQIYERKSVPHLRLLGAVLHDMHKANGIIWSQVTQQMIHECDATPEDASGIINLLNSTREADIAILFREDTDGSVDVGFRSKPNVDVSRIAVALGGGGHPQASGCQLPGPMSEARTRVLDTVHEMRDGDGVEGT